MRQDGMLPAAYCFHPKTLYLTIGVPASGKTVLREECCRKAKKDGLELSVLSADEIRFELLDFVHTGKDFDPAIEPDVWQTVMYRLGKLAAQGAAIFMDATSVSKLDRKRLVSKLQADGYTAEAFFLPIHPIYASWRDANRGMHGTGNNKRSVKPTVIYQKYFALEPPTEDEGFTKITVLPQKPTKAESDIMPNTYWDPDEKACYFYEKM